MWCARFTESQLETLKELIRIQGEVGSDLEGALEALELARRPAGGGAPVEHDHRPG